MEDKMRQLLALGREHYEKRDFEKAEHYLSQIIEAAREYADVHNMMGIIHHDRGRFEQAREAFEEAIKINPNYTEAALNLAVTYNDLGRYDDAKKAYQDAIDRGEHSKDRLDPYVKGKIANLHGQLSTAYAQVGMHLEAIQELHKATKLCPDFPDLRLKLAQLYRDSGDLSSARKELERAIDIKPDYVAAYISLGVVMLAAGKHEEAISRWTQALEIDPTNRSAQMYVHMADRMKKTPVAKAASPVPAERGKKGTKRS